MRLICCCCCSCLSSHMLLCSGPLVSDFCLTPSTYIHMTPFVSPSIRHVCRSCRVIRSSEEERLDVSNSKKLPKSGDQNKLISSSSDPPFLSLVANDGEASVVGFSDWAVILVFQLTRCCCCWWQDQSRPHLHWREIREKISFS